MQILPLQLFVMKWYFPQSQGQTLQYEAYITFLKKKKKADVTN